MFLLTKAPLFSFVYVFYAPVITKRQDDFQDGRRNNDIENLMFNKLSYLSCFRIYFILLAVQVRV